MLTVYLFDQSDARLACAQEIPIAIATAPNAPINQSVAFAPMAVEISQPTSAISVGDHHPKPKPEVNQLLSDAIEFRHFIDQRHLATGVDNAF